MLLRFVETFNSINKFSDCDLPDLTIIHGINGAGKTHLLKAIESGYHVQIFEEERQLKAAYIWNFAENNPFFIKFQFLPSTIRKWCKMQKTLIKRRPNFSG